MPFSAPRSKPVLVIDIVPTEGKRDMNILRGVGERQEAEMSVRFNHQHSSVSGDVTLRVQG